MSNRSEHGSMAARTRVPDAARSRLDPLMVATVLLALACFVVLFFGWNALCLRLGGHMVCRAGFGVLSGWAGFGAVAGLAAVCLVLWEVLAAAGALAAPWPASERQVAAALGAALALFALLRVLTHLRGLTAFGWLGLALAAAACVLAVIRLPGGWHRGERGAGPAETG